MIDISTGKPMTRRDAIKSGLAGILASGVAPWLVGSANASVGGLMRGVGARMATMGGGGWKNPYITDGLIAMWDAEWNAGGGVHDANATVWKDLSGSGIDLNYGASLDANQKWTENSFYKSVKNNFYFSATNIEAIRIACAAGTITVQSVSSISDSSSYNSAILQTGTLSGNIADGLLFLSYNSIGANFGLSDAWAANRTTQSFGGSWSQNGKLLQSSFIANGATINSEVIRLSDDNAFGTSSLPIQSSRSIAANAQILVVGAYVPHSALTGRSYIGDICNIRIYNRAISADKIQHNYLVDKARFNLP